MVAASLVFENFSDVAQALGLPQTSDHTPMKLLSAYNRSVAAQPYKKQDIRLAFKLARDPFYRRAFQYYGSFRKVEEAGFFDDGLPPGVLDKLFDPRLQTTSLDKVKRALSMGGDGVANAKRNIVLLTTGAFAPIHEGHLDMLCAARARLSAEGFNVVGGFIAPAHDYYVCQKGEKAGLWTGERRLAALAKVLEKSDWLVVDPWMCRHTPTDLMFTDVIWRMDKYLAWNLSGPHRIEVAYVFGGDHVAHARTFVKFGMGICVNNRKGYEGDLARIEQEFVGLPDHKMLFAQTSLSNRSSSEIRLGRQPLMGALADNAELQRLTNPLPTPEELSNRYELTFPTLISSDQRGSVNQTWFIGNDFVLTAFQNRSYEAVEAIAQIVRQDTSGLLPKPINGNAGTVTVILGKPAILWHRIQGMHYVEQDHSRKIAIPKVAHRDIAKSFWRVHASLFQSRDLIPVLGIMDYQAIMKETQGNITYAQIPEYLRIGFVSDYLQTPTLPLQHPGLVHTDMERHNLLHGHKGRVLGVVDVDAIMGGDILFEYAHMMMNFGFTDPAYKAESINPYIEELIKANMIAAEHISILPSMIRLFAAEDLLYYYQHERAAKTDLSRLAGIYKTAIGRSDSYFANLQLTIPPKLTNSSNMKQEFPQPK